MLFRSALAQASATAPDSDQKMSRAKSCVSDLAKTVASIDVKVFIQSCCGEFWSQQENGVHPSSNDRNVKG